MFHRGCGRSDGGFSLVEALASLVVVAMIALMLTAGLGAARTVWSRIDVREAGGEAVDSAQAVLRDRIEQVYPATMNDRSPPYIDFQGRADHAVFLSNPPEARRPAPLRRYTLYLDPRGALVLASVSDLAPEGEGVLDRRVLLTGVRSLELDYFGPVFPDEQQRWRRLWRDEAALPEIVRVRVGFEPGDPRSWPDLMIRPRTTIDAQCLLNPVTHRCKGRA